MDNVKVAVIGSGLMGGGIAQACAQAGFTVVNIDIAQAPLDKAQALVAKLLQKKVDKNKMSAEDRSRPASTASPTAPTTPSWPAPSSSSRPFPSAWTSSSPRFRRWTSSPTRTPSF